MMLKYSLGEVKAANRIDSAIKRALKEGFRTKDLSSFGAKEIWGIRGRNVFSLFLCINLKNAVGFWA